MKIHNVNKMPDSYKDGEYELSTLDKKDFIGKFPKKVTDVYYWYATGDYCGAGQVLARTVDNLWYHHDCGHCSCYGPTEEMSFSDEGRSLKDIVNCSADQLKQLKPILDQMKKDGISWNK